MVFPSIENNVTEVHGQTGRNIQHVKDKKYITNIDSIISFLFKSVLKDMNKNINGNYFTVMHI